MQHDHQATGHKGSCHCGAVRFEVTGSLPPPDACHCIQCRRHSSHFYVSTDVSRSNVTLHGADKITWFRSSEKARRGFCSICGCPLFWDPIDQNKHDWIGISMGAFELPTETRLKVHIFVSEKGDYYDIADGVPQHER